MQIKQSGVWVAPPEGVQWKQDGVWMQGTIDVVQVGDVDFSGTSNGQFRYIGAYRYIEMPHTINGVNVTNYDDMFSNQTLNYVISTNSNVDSMARAFIGVTTSRLNLDDFDTSAVVSMRGMFQNSTINQLDLSHFDTSSLTYPREMFMGADIKQLNLTNFDTSNFIDFAYVDMFRAGSFGVLDLKHFDVVGQNVYGMFRNSKIDVLDISTWDISLLLDVGNMFQYQMPGTTYVRSQADLDILIANAGLSQNANVVIGQMP